MKKTLLVSALVLSALSSSALMERATPESQGIDSAAILNWLEACDRAFDGGAGGVLHGFVIVRHGKVVAEGSWKPFDPLTKPHQLFSHSKSFTSTAVGFLVDDGLLDLDERLVDIFPEYVPTNASENLRQVRVRDLLTMNFGAKSADAEATDPCGDWVRNLMMNNTFENRPGQVYRYDSGATYLCAAIVERRSGRKMMDLLRERLFDPIGIGEVRTTFSPQGIPCGGWGMYMTTRDIARFGQLFLNRGSWDGRTIISPEWVTAATSRQTWSNTIRSARGALGSGDNWTQGYGFQFWRNPQGFGYRADGANGQYTIVLPEQDAVVSLAAGCYDAAEELNLVWKILAPAMKDAALPENPIAQSVLERKIASLSVAPVKGVREGSEKFAGVDYVFAPNAKNFHAVRFTKDESGAGWTLRFAANAWHHDSPVAFGRWSDLSPIRFSAERSNPLGLINGHQPTVASAAVQPDGSFRIRVLLRDMTQDLDLVFFETNGVRRVRGRMRGICGVTFEGGEMEANPTPKDVPPLMNGKPWPERRAELVELYRTRAYGVRPVERPADLAFRVVKENLCFGGQARHRTIEAACMGPFAPFAFRFECYEPVNKKNFASFVVLNFDRRLNVDSFNPDADRPRADCWPIDEILARGHATVGFCYNDVARDNPAACYTSGVFAAFGPKVRTETSWGAISAWAWAASRVRDWIATQDAFNQQKVGVVGHSRLGKTALWAAVTDERFSLACSNDSGAGGAKLNHMHQPWSEQMPIVARDFPYWWTKTFFRWVGTKDAGRNDIDQHMLLALVAPRRLAVGSGTEDYWAGPKAEEAATRLAAEAWEALGVGGFGENVFHHYRRGPHDITPEDWAHYMDAMEK